jgi:hypothetical protein
MQIFDLLLKTLECNHSFSCSSILMTYGRDAMGSSGCGSIPEEHMPENDYSWELEET